jgi:glycosyltransferase involved in cell wall biosynthesis
LLGWPQDYLLAGARWADVVVTVAFDDMAFLPYFERSRNIIRRQEVALARNADLCLCTSNELLASRRAWGANVATCLNGVDLEAFCAVSVPRARLRGRPLVGCLGHFDFRIDVGALEEVLVRCDVDVRLVGKSSNPELDRLVERFPDKCVLAPAVSPSDIPEIVRAFDIALLPFKVDAATRAMRPLKYFQYLAMGKPVVTSALPELLPFTKYATVAKTPLDFAVAVDAIARQLPEPSQVGAERRAMASRAADGRATCNAAVDLMITMAHERRDRRGRDAARVASPRAGQDVSRSSRLHL